MAALDGAAWMAAHASTKKGFKTWLKDLADNAQIPVADFVGDLAVELKSSSLLSEAESKRTPAPSDQAPYQAPYQNTCPGLLARFRSEGALFRWWGAPRH